MKNLNSLLILLLCFVSLTSQAALIFDNGFDTGVTNGSTRTSTSINEYVLWDDFSLTQSTTIESLSFLMNGNADFGPTYVEIRDDNAGALGSTIFRSSIARSDIVQTSLPNFFSQFDIDLADFSLDQGNYWISFTNMSFQGTATGTFGSYEMIQSINSLSVPDFVRGDYEVLGQYVPFQIFGSVQQVSEPPLVFLLSLMTFVLIRKRKLFSK